MFPDPSSPTLPGLPRYALMAGPPSPTVQHCPVPATVLITPSGVTFRIRPLPLSAIHRLSDESISMLPVMLLSTALVAVHPSPIELDWPPQPLPPPTNVSILPSVVILRMRRFPASNT